MFSRFSNISKTILSKQLYHKSHSHPHPHLLNNNHHRHLSTPGYITVSIDEALSKTTQALQKIGWDEGDASLQAEIMTSAELCGNNQGLVKMYQPHLMAPSPNAGKPMIERDTLTSAVINGNQAPGMLAAVMAADLAASKVLPVGQDDSGSNNSNSNSNSIAISIVSTYNTCTSSGQLAFYVERMAKKGIIGIGFANSPEFVSAAAGGKPVFGTNPLAVGVPQSKSQHPQPQPPFTFDMATSAIALFGVMTSKAQGRPLPPNVAYDEHGNWTTDASKALDGGGSIATFGGHKGAGLALCVELLAGALSGSAVLGQCESKKVAKNWGHTFIAIRPDCLVDDFEEKVGSILETVKASGGDDDGTRIRIPGENSLKNSLERREKGVMPIPEQIWESILNTAENGLSK